MGQYHLAVNLDRKEFVDPHKLGAGLKLWEQLANHPSTQEALVVLLSCSNGRGGGDISGGADVVGRWAGDRIAYVGDYAEDGDLIPAHQAGKIYEWCREGTYKDVSDLVAPILERELKVRFVGDGWRRVIDAREDAFVPTLEQPVVSPPRDTSETPVLNSLRAMLTRALALVNDPHPGLFTWNKALHDQLNDLVSFMHPQEEEYGT